MRNYNEPRPRARAYYIRVDVLVTVLVKIIQVRPKSAGRGKEEAATRSTYGEILIICAIGGDD